MHNYHQLMTHYW